MNDTNFAYKNFYDVGVIAAKGAGQIQKNRVNTTLNIEFKGQANLVTEVDKACEKFIVDTISQAFPDHDIMGEEGLGTRKNSEYKWIIDPLDGTTNFAHGYPLFCVSIALEHQGQIIGGIVYDPNRDELFTAFRGYGAYLNGQKISVSTVPTLEQGLLATGFAYNFRTNRNNNFDHFFAVMQKAQGVRRDGVAAIDICYVACGRYDGFWELGLFPWDTGAGFIIASEAGATVTRFDGSTCTVYDKDLLITNGKIHTEMVHLLLEGVQKRQFGS